MKLNKTQKKIVRKIASGEIYDIYSYLNSFDLISLIQYDKATLEDAFRQDNIPKEYYYLEGHSPSPITIETQENFFQKTENGLLRLEDYSKFSLVLNYNTGIKLLSWNNVDYTLDFYTGIEIATSFDSILSFLSLWQYLKSEMLILELATPLTSQTLGLFYEKHHNAVHSHPTSIEEKINQIDYEHLSYSDSDYLTDDYIFSTEHCTICKDYIEKRIHPTPELHAFIHHGQKTAEERSRSHTLFVAWLAIFVSIILAFTPFRPNVDTKHLSIIAIKIQNVERQLSILTEQSNSSNNELRQRIDTTNQYLREIANLINPDIQRKQPLCTPNPKDTSTTQD